MKKLITLAASLFFACQALVGLAQEGKKAQKTETKQEISAETGKKLKKDGTPDKRYKENKEPEKPTGPLKKDGTPDKRYKENKTEKK